MESIKYEGYSIHIGRLLKKRTDYNAKKVSQIPVFVSAKKSDIGENDFHFLFYENNEKTDYFFDKLYLILSKQILKTFSCRVDPNVIYDHYSALLDQNDLNSLCLLDDEICYYEDGETIDYYCYDADFQSDEVLRIIDIDDFEIIDMNNTENSEMLHVGNDKKLIINGNSIKIVFPFGENEILERTIETETERELISKYILLKKNNYITFPTLDVITQRISSIIEYVNSFDFDQIAKTYNVTESGYFQNRPGRDDHFNIYRYHTIDSDDMYIHTLFHLGEDFRYYSCCGRGAGDDDYSNQILDDEITKGIENAQKKYSKKEHYSFLILEYFKDLYTRKDTCTKLNIEIDELLHYNEAKKIFDARCWELFNPSSYNQSVIDVLNGISNKESKLSEFIDSFKDKYLRESKKFFQ